MFRRNSPAGPDIDSFPIDAARDTRIPRRFLHIPIPAVSILPATQSARHPRFVEIAQKRCAAIRVLSCTRNLWKAHMDLEFRNAYDIDTHGTGWIVGHGDWLQRDARGGQLRYMPQHWCSRSLCMKWMHHPAGDPRGVDKPKSEGRTMSVMVSESGRFRLQFSNDPSFESDVVEHVFDRHGQCAIWGEGLYHRWFVDAECTILTLRWIPEPRPDFNKTISS
jgi:hypothetical protein